MRIRAWICTFFTAFVCGTCPFAYSMRCVAILEVHIHQAQLHHLQGKKLLEQEWQQLALIPVQDYAMLDFQILRTALPGILSESTKFISCSTSDNTPFFTCIPDTPNNKTAYICWLINTPSPVINDFAIHTLYKQLLFTIPMQPLNELQSGIKIHSTDTPEQFTIKAKLPGINKKQFLLSSYIAERSKGYTLTPITRSANAIPSLVSQLGAMSIAGQPPSRPIKKLPPKSPMSPPIPIPYAGTPDDVSLPDSTKTIVPHSHIMHGEKIFLTIEQLKDISIQRPELLDWKPGEILSKTRNGIVQLYSDPSLEWNKLVIKKIHILSDRFMHLSREASMLHQISHENIVKLEGIAIPSSPAGGQELWLALEYIAQGDMRQQLREHPHSFTEENIKIILVNIVRAIQYLHSQSIAHRDIKPDNILLEFDRGIASIVKVTDFGLATTFGSGQYNAVPCGSPSYAAPEALMEPDDHNAEKIDIWGVGITAYALFVKGSPHLPDAPRGHEKRIQWRKQNTHRDVGSDVSIQTLREATPKLSNDGIEMVRLCCERDPGRRPSIDNVARNPFLQKRIHQPESALVQPVPPRKGPFKHFLKRGEGH